MDSTKHLLYHELFDYFKQNDDTKVKKSLEELSGNKGLTLSELEDLNIATIGTISGRGEKELLDALTRNNISVGEVLIKVGIRIIKRNPISTRCCTLWQC